MKKTNPLIGPLIYKKSRLRPFCGQWILKLSRARNPMGKVCLKNTG